MKRNTLSRLLCIALLACAPAGLARCGGTASTGTETGNPPVIDNQKLRLEWTPNGVRLIGEPGAVLPGAEVRLTNTRTGVSASVVAGDDGSLSLEVAGNLSDPYEVHVSSRGREMTEPLSARDDLAQHTCQELSVQAAQAEAAAADAAERACSVDADCSLSRAQARCAADCGYPHVVASSALQQLPADIAAAAEAVCQEFDAQACPPQIIPCPAPPINPRAVCRNDRCELESDTP